MKRFIKRIHKYLAIPAGLIISITCLTGAILIFQDEILELAYPSRYFIKENQTEIIPLDELIESVNSRLEDNSVITVTIYSDTERTYKMGLANGFRVSAFVNPYTGEITGIYKTQESFFYKIMTLHRWLMDGSRTWGKYTVGISTLLFAVILISGLVLWMPRQRKKSRFKIQYKKGKPRLIKDLHDVLGMYACLVLLICALTGMMWSFDWYKNGIFRLFGGEVATNSGHSSRGGQKKELPAIDYSNWNKAYGLTLADNPDNEYIQVGDGSITVHSLFALLSRDSDRYNFDSKTGNITKKVLFEEQPKNTRIWAWVYSLHVGNYWGIFSKIFTCLFALVGASLPITGYYVYFRKKKLRKRRG